MGTSYKPQWVPPKEAQYAVYQMEKCPKTEKLHWQWMLVFPQRKRWTAICQLLSPDHVEICRDPKKSRQYCMKEETRIPGTKPKEEGTWPESNSTLIDSIREKRLIELIEEHPWKVRQLKELKAYIAEPRNFLTNGILLTGSTGKGKSKIASIIHSFLGDAYWTEPSLTWFDGYDSQSLCIVDEMRGSKPEFLLRFLDRYPLLLPYKGGFTQMRSNMVIMTSNLTLREMYPTLDNATLDALRRRILELTVY